jgi:DNA-binding MarR family transcriptional regulator
MLKHDSTPAASALLTDVILLIFRVNGQLLVAGDRLVEHLHLTSARWQMLGAVALSPSLRTAPQLAAAMGVTRQGAQKQLNLLLETGLVEAEPNPGHTRSPLYVLTRKGASLYAETERVQRAWVMPLIGSIPMSDVHAAKRLLEAMSERLTSAGASRAAKSARRVR